MKFFIISSNILLDSSRTLSQVCLLVTSLVFTLGCESKISLPDADPATLKEIPNIVPLSTIDHTPSLAQRLYDCTYEFSDIDAGFITLENGYFEKSYELGGATKIIIKLGQQFEISDINNDNQLDAVVTLIADYGGTGTFTYLAVVINKENVLIPTNTICLGDRIGINKIQILANHVVVDIIDRSVDQAAAERPTIIVPRYFKLKENTLTEVVK